MKFKGGSTRSYEVKVGVHQGSILSPLLYFIVQEAKSRIFTSDLPLELLHADDMAVVAESKQDLPEKFLIWKAGLVAKGLKVNTNKIKILLCMGSIERNGDSGKSHCGREL